MCWKKYRNSRITNMIYKGPELSGPLLLLGWKRNNININFWRPLKGRH